MKTLFENPHVLVVDKPGGWLSVPSRLGAKDPRPCLGPTLERQHGLRLWPVHRLDEEVTGVIVFAKTAAAHRLLNGWFERREVTKTYEAWSEVGTASPATIAGTASVFESQLLRGKKRAYISPHGKPARTEAVCRGGRRHPMQAVDVLAWELVPVTGRSHQLRFELAHRGWPILGDDLYGATLPFIASEPQTIALRCVRLDLTNAPDVATLELPLQINAAPLSDLSLHLADGMTS